MKPTMDKKTRELVIQCGEELAYMQLRKAIEEADSPEQAANQIFALQVMSQSILATCAYNAEQRDGLDSWDVIDKFCEEMKSLTENMFENDEMELHVAKGHLQQ